VDSDSFDIRLLGWDVRMQKIKMEVGICAEKVVAPKEWCVMDNVC